MFYKLVWIIFIGFVFVLFNLFDFGGLKGGKCYLMDKFLFGEWYSMFC